MKYLVLFLIITGCVSTSMRDTIRQDCRTIQIRLNEHFPVKQYEILITAANGYVYTLTESTDCSTLEVPK